VTGRIAPAAIVTLQLMALSSAAWPKSGHMECTIHGGCLFSGPKGQTVESFPPDHAGPTKPPVGWFKLVKT
jgi:hypothetical protein